MMNLQAILGMLGPMLGQGNGNGPGYARPQQGPGAMPAAGMGANTLGANRQPLANAPPQPMGGPGMGTPRSLAGAGPNPQLLQALMQRMGQSGGGQAQANRRMAGGPMRTKLRQQAGRSGIGKQRVANGGNPAVGAGASALAALLGR